MVEFHVLRCAECQTFQVLQVTKSSKWKCKLCGQKQSIVKVYGQGTGAECRKHVQKLNRLRGEINEVVEEKSLLSASVPYSGSNVVEESYCAGKVNSTAKLGSRWSSFIENSNDQVDSVSESSAADNESGIRFHVTTDWAEYQDTKKRKRAQLRTEYSARRSKSQKPNDYQFGSDGQKNFAFEKECENERDTWENSKSLLTNNKTDTFNRNANVSTTCINLKSGIIDREAKINSATAVHFFPSKRSPDSWSREFDKPGLHADESAQGNTFSRKSHYVVQETDMTSSVFLSKKDIQEKMSSAKPKSILSRIKKEQASVSSKWGEFLEDEDGNESDSDDESDQLYLNSNDLNKSGHLGTAQNLDSNSFSLQLKTSNSLESCDSHQKLETFCTENNSPKEKSVDAEQEISDSEQVKYKAVIQIVDHDTDGMFDLGYNLDDEDFDL